MTTDPHDRGRDRLLRLLPAYYRQLDAEAAALRPTAAGRRPGDAGVGPLQALLWDIADQVTAVEDEIEQSYDDLFIETCRPWVAPYLGDLVGYETTYDPAGAAADPLLSPRADVANTVAFRRRKGTPGVLEDLTAAVAGWPAVAIELADRVARFVDVRERTQPPPWSPFRPNRGGLASVRDWATRVRRGTPFDRAARFVDVRRVDSHRTPGRADVFGVGVFAYRLRAAPVVGGTPYPVDQDKGRYTFDPLGLSAPLFIRPDEDARGDDPLRVPGPIPRAALPWRPPATQRPPAEIDGLFRRLYSRPSEEVRRRAGAGRGSALDPDPWSSLAILVAKEPPGEPGAVARPPERRGPGTNPGVTWELVAADKVFGADLDWDVATKPSPHVPPDGVALDPWRGRFLLGGDLAKRAAGGGVRVTYHTAVADTIGAGGHPAPEPTKHPYLRAYDPAATGDDFFAWLNQQIAAWPQESETEETPSNYSELLVEVNSSATLGVLTDVTVGLVPPDRVLHIRAGRVDTRDTTHRPVFRNDTGRPRTVEFRLATTRAETTGPAPTVGGRLVLEGLTFADVELRVTRQEPDAPEPPPAGEPPARRPPCPEPAAPPGELTAELELRRVTVVPPRRPVDGPAAAKGDAAGAAPWPRTALVLHDLPVRAEVRESILGPVQADRGGRAGAPVRLTVADSVWDAGCPRRVVLAGPGGCHAPAELAVWRSTVRGRVQVHALDPAVNTIFLGLIDVARQRRGEMRYCYYVPGPGDRTPRRVGCQPETARQAALACGLPAPAAVAPEFTTTTFGRPGYFQLAAGTPPFILAGAEDEGEIGAYHRLGQFRRADRLRARLADFVPTGFEAALIFVT